MSSKSEILALAFGALLILVTFGDAHIFRFVGNLDTIFGHAFWPALDTIYPLATIVIFLLYGWVKGNGLKFDAMTALLFLSFVTVLILVDIDDFAQVLNVTLVLSRAYWTVMMWVYPIYSGFAFFLFGKTHEKTRTV